MNRFPVTSILLPGLVLAVLTGCAGRPAAVNAPPELQIGCLTLDAALADDWKQAGFSGTPERAGNATLLRRLRFDLTGRPPTVEEAKAFAKNPDFSAKVDEILDSEAFARNRARLWGDRFRIKSEFPINLWPNAVQAFDRWLFDAARTDRPWNETATALLTANGSNFRNPPTNFFRTAPQRTPDGFARIALAAFWCDTPDNRPEPERAEFVNAFRQLRFKPTGEWKEEIVYDEFSGDNLRLRAARKIVEAPEFARAAVNTVWKQLFGTGLIEPADGIGRPASSVNKLTMAYLTNRFVRNGYRFKPLYREILLSNAYRAASTGNAATRAETERRGFRYPLRRLDAESIADLLAAVTEAPETYSSVIPEPFTYLPPEAGAVAIPDGSITSSLLEKFGKPARDTGAFDERNNRVTAAQRQYLLNSAKLYWQMMRVPQRLFRKRRLTDREKIDEIYLLLLARNATPEERRLVLEYREKSGRGNAVWGDLVWMLVNGKEFIFQY